MFIAERFISNLVKRYEEQPVSTDGGTLYPLQACKFLKIKHHLHHSAFEKSIIKRERTIQ
jgi:putative transposase